jgi:hypothetical protein
LNIAPDVDSDDENGVRGPKFLEDFEKKRRDQAKAKEGDGASSAELSVKTVQVE